jgi:hypothetical protein
MGVNFTIKKNAVLMSEEVFVKCFLHKPMHPFTYFALNPEKMDEYFLNYLSMKMKLELFGKEAF